MLAQGNGGDKEWASYGNDPGNMRFQDVDQINPSNVGDLQPAWILYTGVGSAKTSFEAQPIVVDGTMYVATPHNHVIALDPGNGRRQVDLCADGHAAAGPVVHLLRADQSRRGSW
ncbi:MAG: hypothetical protein R2838_05870 [Caldilineaceae bacterium]